MSGTQPTTDQDSPPTVTCDKCGHTYQIGDFPFCPHQPGPAAVARDEIPGGVTLENYGRHPVTFYSHSERRRYMLKHNLREKESFAPFPGTDKDPQGIPNPAGFMDPKTLDNARVLLSRNGDGAKVEDFDDNSEPYAEAIRPFNNSGDSVAALMTIGAIETFERQGGNKRDTDVDS